MDDPQKLTGVLKDYRPWKRYMELEDAPLGSPAIKVETEKDSDGEELLVTHLALGERFCRYQVQLREGLAAIGLEEGDEDLVVLCDLKSANYTSLCKHYRVQHNIQIAKSDHMRGGWPTGERLHLAKIFFARVMRKHDRLMAAENAVDNKRNNKSTKRNRKRDQPSEDNDATEGGGIGSPAREAPAMEDRHQQASKKRTMEAKARDNNDETMDDNEAPVDNPEVRPVDIKSERLHLKRERKIKREAGLSGLSGVPVIPAIPAVPAVPAAPSANAMPSTNAMPSAHAILSATVNPSANAMPSATVNPSVIAMPSAMATPSAHAILSTNAMPSTMAIPSAIAAMAASAAVRAVSVPSTISTLSAPAVKEHRAVTDRDITRSACPSPEVEHGDDNTAVLKEELAGNIKQEHGSEQTDIGQVKGLARESLKRVMSYREWGTDKNPIELEDWDTWKSLEKGIDEVIEKTFDSLVVKKAKPGQAADLDRHAEPEE